MSNEIQETETIGWTSEVEFSLGTSSSQRLLEQLIGNIYHEDYIVCSGSLIGNSTAVSISRVFLNLRPTSLLFKTKGGECIQVISFEQHKTISGFIIISFKLGSEIGQKKGYFGVLSFMDKEKYESFDYKNKQSCVQIPYQEQEQYITDIQDDIILFLNIPIIDNSQQTIEFLGLPIVWNHPKMGPTIIALIIKSAPQCLKAVLLRPAHINFLQKSIAGLPNLKDKEESEFIKNRANQLERREVLDQDGSSHKDGVYSVCRINHSTLASSSVDKKVKIWDWKTNKCESFESDGNCRYLLCEENLLVGTNENKVVIIDWQSKSIKGVVQCKHKLYSLLVLKQQGVILAGDCFGNIAIIKIKEEKKLTPRNNSSRDGKIGEQKDLRIIHWIDSSKEQQGHKGSINVLHNPISSKMCENIFFSGGEFGEIKIWGSDNYQFKGEFFGHEKDKSVYFIESQINNDKHIMISGGSDKSIKIWDVGLRAQIYSISLQSPLYAACLINSSELIFGESNEIKMLDIHTYHISSCLSSHTSRINAFCPISATSFASGDIQGMIFIWNLPQKNISESKYQQQKQQQSQKNSKCENDNKFYSFKAQNQQKINDQCNQIRIIQERENNHKAFQVSDELNQQNGDKEDKQQERFNDKSPSIYKNNLMHQNCQKQNLMVKENQNEPTREREPFTKMTDIQFMNEEKQKMKPRSINSQLTTNSTEQSQSVQSLAPNQANSRSKLPNDSQVYSQQRALSQTNSLLSDFLLKVTSPTCSSPILSPSNNQQDLADILKYYDHDKSKNSNQQVQITNNHSYNSSIQENHSHQNISNQMHIENQSQQQASIHSNNSEGDTIPKYGEGFSLLKNRKNNLEKDQSNFFLGNQDQINNTNQAKEKTSTKFFKSYQNLNKSSDTTKISTHSFEKSSSNLAQDHSFKQALSQKNSYLSKWNYQKEHERYKSNDSNSIEINKLIAENSLLKEQLKVVKHQNEKYSIQIQQLIDTLQISEQERLDTVELIAPQLKSLSRIADNLMESNSQKQEQITKQEAQLKEKDEEIANMNSRIKELEQNVGNLKEQLLTTNISVSQQNSGREGKQSTGIAKIIQQKPILSTNQQDSKREISQDKFDNFRKSSDQCLQSNKLLRSEEQISCSNQLPMSHNIHSNSIAFQNPLSFETPRTIQLGSMLGSSFSSNPNNSAFCKEQVMIELRIAQEEAYSLQKQINHLKAQTIVCSNEGQMSQLINSLRITLSKYEQTKESIQELKSFYGQV